MNDNEKLQEARKQLMASWLLMEQDDSYLPSGSEFFGSMAGSLGRVGSAFKQGAFDVASSAWGLGGVLKALILLDPKKAEEKYQATKKRSRTIAAQYSSTRNRINQTLSSPGAMIFLGGVLGPSLATSNYVLGSMYNSIKDPSKDLGGKWDDYLNKRINNYFPVQEEKKKNGNRNEQEQSTIASLKQLFYGKSLNDAREFSEFHNLISEEKEGQQKSEPQTAKEFKKEIATESIKALRQLFLLLHSAGKMADVVAEQIENYNLTVAEIKKKEKDIPEQEKAKSKQAMKEKNEEQQNFVKSKKFEFQKTIDELLSIEFIRSEIEGLQVGDDAKSWEAAGSKLKQAIPASVRNELNK